MLFGLDSRREAHPRHVKEKSLSHGGQRNHTRGRTDTFLQGEIGKGVAQRKWAQKRKTGSLGSQVSQGGGITLIKGQKKGQGFDLLTGKCLSGQRRGIIQNLRIEDCE